MFNVNINNNIIDDEEEEDEDDNDDDDDGVRAGLANSFTSAGCRLQEVSSNP